MPPSFERPSERDAFCVDASVRIAIDAGSPSLLALRVSPPSGTEQTVKRHRLVVNGVEMSVDGVGLVRASIDGASSVITGDCRVQLHSSPDLGPLPFGELVRWLTPSRFCPSDRMAGFARTQFGVSGIDVIERVAEFVNERVLYEPNSSLPYTDALDTLTLSVGVCRDFAHLMISLLRALGIPARYVAVYAPGLEPPDFHAVVEAHDGVRWRLIDPSGLSDPTVVVRICHGHDSADTPFLSVLSGWAPIDSVEVSASIVF